METMQALDDIAAGVGALLVRLEAVTKSQAAVTELLDAERAHLEDREGDLVRVWALVAGACDRVSAAVETDRTEREHFIERFQALAPPSTAGPTAALASTSRILGGSVFVAPRDPHIDLTNPARIEDGLGTAPSDPAVEVWNVFDADWVSGFEICGEVEDNDVVQFQIRRRSDGAVLPRLFGAADIRPQADPTNQLRLWTRARAQES
jgi:uncharacterized membrane protein YebE (DUF533 family)